MCDASSTTGGQISYVSSLQQQFDSRATPSSRQTFMLRDGSQIMFEPGNTLALVVRLSHPLSAHCLRRRLSRRRPTSRLLEGSTRTSTVRSRLKVERGNKPEVFPKSTVGQNKVVRSERVQTLRPSGRTSGSTLPSSTPIKHHLLVGFQHQN